MDLLPKWKLTGTLPASRDSESSTCIEMTYKLYQAMQNLISEYTAFSSEVSTTLSENEEKFNQDLEIYATGLRQEFQDFIDVIDLKLSSFVDDEEEIMALQSSVSDLTKYIENVRKDLQAQIDSIVLSNKEDANVDNATILLINEKINSINSSISSLTSELSSAKSRISSLETRVKTLEEKPDVDPELETRVANVEREAINLDKDLEKVRGRVTLLENNSGSGSGGSDTIITNRVCSLDNTTLIKKDENKVVVGEYDHSRKVELRGYDRPVWNNEDGIKELATLDDIAIPLHKFTEIDEVVIDELPLNEWEQRELTLTSDTRIVNLYCNNPDDAFAVNMNGYKLLIDFVYDERTIVLYEKSLMNYINETESDEYIPGQITTYVPNSYVVDSASAGCVCLILNTGKKFVAYFNNNCFIIKEYYDIGEL